MFQLDAEHVLRPVRSGDGAALASAYRANREHLAPWEPIRDEDFFTAEWQEHHARECEAEADAGRSLRFVIEAADGEIRGRANLNNIVRGAFWSTDLGYWVGAGQLRRGLGSRAVATIVQYARVDLGLHRIQAATLLHNHASQRVLTGNGFERIGIAPRYLRIAGHWQDHVLFQRILDDEKAPPASTLLGPTPRTSVKGRGGDRG